MTNKTTEPIIDLTDSYEDVIEIIVISDDEEEIVKDTKVKEDPNKTVIVLECD